jgi:hypothetical protein
VHPGDKLSDADPQSDTDTNAEAKHASAGDATTHGAAHPGGNGACRTNRRTDAAAGDNTDADTNTDDSVAQPRSRRARTVRFGRHARFGRVDLAAVPELICSRSSRVVVVATIEPTP